MASSSVREGFDRLAGEYDALKLRVIPGYREVQALVDRYAAVPDRAAARVLELGFGTGEWAERFLGFDLVVSFFALHHVSDKRWLIEEVTARLVEGGRLLWADITTAATPALEQLFIDDWVAFMRQTGLEEEGIAHVLQDHRENDLPETVESQLAYMQQAGLDPAAVVWSHGKFVLFFGGRST